MTGVIGAFHRWQIFNMKYVSSTSTSEVQDVGRVDSFDCLLSGENFSSPSSLMLDMVILAARRRNERVMIPCPWNLHDEPRQLSCPPPELVWLHTAVLTFIIVQIVKLPRPVSFNH